MIACNGAEYLLTIHAESDKVHRPHEAGHLEEDATVVGTEDIRHLPATGGNLIFELGHLAFLRLIFYQAAITSVTWSTSKKTFMFPGYLD